MRNDFCTRKPRVPAAERPAAARLAWIDAYVYMPFYEVLAVLSQCKSGPTETSVNNPRQEGLVLQPARLLPDLVGDHDLRHRLHLPARVSRLTLTRPPSAVPDRREGW